MARTAAAILLFGAAGCRSPLAVNRSESVLRAEGNWVLVEGLDVPAARHGPAGCGAQALATVLARGGEPGGAQSLADALPWQDRGATPVDLLLEARKRGAEATVARGTWEALAERLAEGEPALVMIDAAPDMRFMFMDIRLHRLMHWAVVSGMDRDGTRLLLAARHHRHSVVGREDFQERWDLSDCCMILLPGPSSFVLPTPD